MKLVYQLIQETPMIHFQADDSNVTLRASEVKPKLDKFLAEWCKRYKGMDIWTEHEDWKVSEKHNSLDYRMTIRSLTPPKVTYPPDPQKDKMGLYFGNMGDDTEKRKIIFVEGEIELTILCFHKELSQIIQDSLPFFFLLHNFGTRQDKGFGGYVLKDSVKNAERLLVDWYKHENKSIYMLDCASSIKSQNKIEVFRNIDVIYKVLKSGINESFKRNKNSSAKYCYVKSYLTKYFLNKGIGGEKRYIKEQEIGPNKITFGKSENNPVTKYRYIRGLLGVTDVQEWQEKHSGKSKIEIKAVNSDIMRMASPIVFKLAGKVLFILVNEPNSDIYGQEFKFSSKMGEGTLKVPLREEFDMDEMFSEFVEYINSKEIRDKLQLLMTRPKFVSENRLIIKRGGN